MLYYKNPEGVRHDVSGQTQNYLPGFLDIITDKGIKLTIPQQDLRDDKEDAAQAEIERIKQQAAEEREARPVETKLKELAEGDPKDMSPEGMVIAGIGKLLSRFDELRAIGKQSFYDDVVDFHRHFQIDHKGGPRKLPDSLKSLRDARLDEEMTEYWDACAVKDVEKQLDAMVDIIYIILGTCHLHGWDFNEAWRRVHQANMKKARDVDGTKGRYKDKQDIYKPMGWVAPILRDLVTFKVRPEGYKVEKPSIT